MTSRRGAAGRAAGRPSAATTVGFLSFPQFVIVWNKLQGLYTPAFHLTICRWLYGRWLAGERRLLLMVFRDAGKSTLVGLFVAWLLTGNPNLRILIVAAEQMLANKMSRNIRRIIERHPAAGHLLEHRPENWAVDQFTVRRVRNHRDPSVLARGLNGNITGTRADIVICDDVEVPNTCNTAASREELRQRLAEIDFVLVPTGLQLFVGTPHSYYSIYADRPRREIGEDKPFLDRFERLCLPLVQANGSSAWPERFPADVVEDLRRHTGPQRFRSQMMLEPTPPRAVKLDPDRLIPYADPLDSHWSHGRLRLAIGQTAMVSSVCWWDPAYGRPGRGDRSAIAVVMVDRDGHYWLHGVRYLQFSAEQIDNVDEATQLIRQAIAFALELRQARLFIETNGIGRFLPSLVRRELKGSGHNLTLIERHSSRGKTDRILSALDPILAAGHLHVHETVLTSGFIEEMREWAPGTASFDDGLDAVSNAILEQPVQVGRRIGGSALQGEPSFVADASFSI
jgi:predicted phage terminase large subunit-like protein